MEIPDTGTVLIVAHTTTFLTELSLFGELVRARTAARTVFYCPFGHWTAERFAELCAAEGVTCLLPPLADGLSSAGFTPRPGAGEGGGANRFLARVVGRLMRDIPGIGSSYMSERLGLVAAAHEVEMLLDAVSPQLLVLGGDMVGYDTAVYVQLARRRGVRTLIVPSTMSNGLEQAEVYHADPNYHVRGWAGALIARLFPKWVREHKGRRLFRVPPGRVLAMELAGLAPPLPWAFNSGYADAIAMESQAMIDYYAEVGMNDGRMVLTGTLSDDEMAARLANVRHIRSRLCAELGLDPGRPLVLVALPPDFLYLTGGRPECDFSTYNDLVEFWISTLSDQKGCSVVVALHPSVDAESMRHIERRGIRIGTWRTAEMVPACDVYVASISSTIRWAIACAKPVVNYDVYRYRYTDFHGVPGVLTMEEQDEFRSALRQLVEDEGYRAALSAAQAAASPNWALLDGKVGDRMLDLVVRLSGIRERPIDGSAEK